MLGWLKRRSLVLTGSLLMSVLLLVIVGAMSAMMYNAEKRGAYREFEQVGMKLRDQGAANEELIRNAAAALKAGKKPAEADLALLKRQLDGMADGSYIANAYYILPEATTRDGKHYVHDIQVNEALAAAGGGAGDELEADATFVEAFEGAKTGQGGFTPVYTDQFGTWLTYMASIRGRDGTVDAIFGIDYDYGKVESRMNGLLWKSIGLGLLAAALGIGLVVLLMRAALKPLRVLAATAKEAAHGNLTVRVPVAGGNEIGQAAGAFNEMIASLRELAVHIDRTSRDVSESSRGLKETASQTAAAANEIATAIQGVASGSETQLVSSQECQRATSEMATGVQRIAESSSVVAELASGTMTLALDGERVIGRTVRQMGAIEEHVGRAAESMRELQQSSARIEDILAHIAEVAKQTNLLALNASIEAARAGEHGQGFAVVAKEIRKLAERSKEASDEIAAILHEIGSRSRDVAATLQLSATETREGSELAGATTQSFRSILAAVREVSEQVQEVSAASQQMSAGSEQIAASLDELERMAQTSASHSEEVAAASEEQLASVEEVVGASEQLRSLAEELREAVGRFRV